MRSRSYYFKRYRQFLEPECERCGSTEHLLIHHKDEDFSNNVPENLETLCKRCHQIEHKCWEVLPDNTGRTRRSKIPRPCEWCGVMFVYTGNNKTQRCCSRSCAQYRRFATSSEL